jgi:hypothetical protein
MLSIGSTVSLCYAHAFAVNAVIDLCIMNSSYVHDKNTTQINVHKAGINVLLLHFDK